MRWFVILFLLVCHFSANAGHLVGGEMSYTQIGLDSYLIELKMYRDCYAAFPSVQRFDEWVNMSVYDASNDQLIDWFRIRASNDSTRLPLSLKIPCLPDPPDLCILEMVYRDTLILNVPPSGAYIVNERCCRSPNSLNIVNPSDFGSTYTVFIPSESNTQGQNSSPQFNSIPPIALCSGIPLELDYSATDPDGDSLFYEFCDPFHGGGAPALGGQPAPDTPASKPFTTITWGAGYSTNNQLPSNPAFTIDPATGIVTGTPTSLGTYVFGVCVSEYRDGVLLGRNKRDFQMTITPCEVEALSIIDSAIEECIGRNIQFYNLSTLGDSFEWDFGVLNSSTDTSQKLNPSYTFPDTGVYTIRLISTGAEGCKDTTYLDYHVLPEITPGFDAPSGACFDNHSFSFIAGGVARPTTEMHWIFDNDTIYPDKDAGGVYNYSFDKLGLHSATLVYEDFGCYKDSTRQIKLQPNPRMILNEGPFSDCPPVQKSYSVSTQFALKPTISWFLNGASVSNDSVYDFSSDTPGNYDLSIRLNTDSICIDTLEIFYPKHISVLEKPIAGFSVNDHEQEMWEPEFILADKKINAISHTFYLDSSLISKETHFEFTIADTGSYGVTQIARHRNGCLDTLTDTIRVIPDFLVYIPNSFTPNADGFNDFWLPSVFVWKEFKLRIFSRWGEEIFYSDNPNFGWNGQKQKSGVDSPEGVYLYWIDIIGPDLRQWQYTGQISLIR